MAHLDDELTALTDEIPNLAGWEEAPESVARGRTAPIKYKWMRLASVLSRRPNESVRLEGVRTSLGPYLRKHYDLTYREVPDDSEAGDAVTIYVWFDPDNVPVRQVDIDYEIGPDPIDEAGEDDSGEYYPDGDEE